MRREGAVAEGDLAVISKDLALDVKDLADLHEQCMTKATKFEAEVKSVRKRALSKVAVEPRAG